MLFKLLEVLIVGGGLCAAWIILHVLDASAQKKWMQLLESKWRPIGRTDWEAIEKLSDRVWVVDMDMLNYPDYRP